jgi:hypothetical protein
MATDMSSTFGSSGSWGAGPRRADMRSRRLRNLGAGTAAQLELKFEKLGGEISGDLAVENEVAVGGDVEVAGELAVGGDVTVAGVATADTVLTLHRQAQLLPSFVPELVDTGLPSLATNYYYAGGTLGPNGKVYMIPGQAPSVLVFDPPTRAVSFIGLGGSGAFPVEAGLGGYLGGSLAPNGKIYCAPDQSTTRSVLVIDTKDDSLYRIPFPAPNEAKKGRWSGTVIGTDGKIYCIPQEGDPDNANSISFIVIDPATDALTFLAGTPPYTESGDDRWFGGVLGPNGKIYCIPRNSPNILILDPLQSPPTLVALGKRGAQYFGGALGPDGNIYCIPRTANEYLKIIPGVRTTPGAPTTTDALGPGVTSIGTSGFFGGVLAPDGRIYGIPNEGSGLRLVKALDVASGTTEIVLSIPFEIGDITTAYYFGGVLTRDNEIVCVPFREGRIMVFRTGLPRYSQWMLDATFNKF